MTVLDETGGRVAHCRTKHWGWGSLEEGCGGDRALGGLM